MKMTTFWKQCEITEEAGSERVDTYVGSTTSDFGPDLHVFLQVGQRLQVLLGTSRHHFLQLDVHLAQALLVQPGQRRKTRVAVVFGGKAANIPLGDE